MFEYFSPSKNNDLMDSPIQMSAIPDKIVQNAKKSVEIHGHRGARGLAPENTLPGFEEAIEIGVDAIELDVVITKDEKVLVSHEAWMNPEICLDPNGNEIDLSDLDKHRIYQMSFEETQAYECGLKSPLKFPNQYNESCTKPLLSSVLQMGRALAKNHGRKLKYSIEIKSFPEGDDVFHPKPAKFCRLVIEVVRKYVKEKRVYIQSFDARILKHFHNYYPEIKLGYLFSHDDLDKAYEELGFLPHFYGIQHDYIDHKLVKKAEDLEVKIFAWTVNQTEEMERLIGLKVNAIITDYPNQAIRFK